jgi:glycosyltransferase involved in cell wall biosynthesis
MFWYFLAIACLLPWVVVLVNGWLGNSRIPALKNLPDGEIPIAEPIPADPKKEAAAKKAAEATAEAGTPPQEPEPAPEPEPLGPRKISVVIAARDEASHIEKALRTLAAQTHLNYEIIVVNDRSTDETGNIVDRLSQEFPGKIVALHVHELPEGWLGKCNALQLGGEAATGEYILFTDADVEFEETVLVRAHLYALRENADQLAVIPETIAGSFWEKAMLNVFGLMFFLRFPPHRVMVRNSGHFIGIGAFNMVSTAMYRKIQGHRFLRLQVVDDMGLGKLVKYSGGTVRVAFGVDVVRVRWQVSLAATIKGLEKNFFAATNYSVLLTTFATVGVWIMFLWPWLGVWFGPAGARVISGLALALQMFLCGAAATKVRFSPIHAVTAQFGGLFMSIAMLRSAIVTLRRGGVTWRDSFYPLKDLRQFRL